MSPEKAIDVLGTEAHFLDVLATQGDVVVDVEVAGGLAVLVQPDQRTLDVKNTFTGSSLS
jgi:hypothetical protein